jgi:hypothetical protein
VNIKLCRTGKKGFATRADAEEEVRRAKMQHQSEFSTREVATNCQECPYCFEYHLTRDPKWKTRTKGTTNRSRRKNQPWGSR